MNFNVVYSLFFYLVLLQLYRTCKTNLKKSMKRKMVITCNSNEVGDKAILKSNRIQPHKRYLLCTYLSSKKPHKVVQHHNEEVCVYYAAKIDMPDQHI